MNALLTIILTILSAASGAVFGFMVSEDEHKAATFFFVLALVFIVMICIIQIAGVFS